MQGASTLSALERPCLLPSAYPGSQSSPSFGGSPEATWDWRLAKASSQTLSQSAMTQKYKLSKSNAGLLYNGTPMCSSVKLHCHCDKDIHMGCSGALTILRTTKASCHPKTSCRRTHCSNLGATERAVTQPQNYHQRVLQTPLRFNRTVNLKVRAGHTPDSTQGLEIEKPSTPIFVIATDVDGTLLDSKQQLRPETVAALRAAMARGVQVVIATGKARGPWVDTVLPQLGLATPGVYMQGLMLYGADGSIQHERYMSTALACKTIAIGAAEGLTITGYSGNRIFCASCDKHTNRLIGYGEPIPEPIGETEMLAGNIRFNKILFMGEQSVLDKVRPTVQSSLGRDASIVTALNGMLEILPPGASKGLGLSMVLEHMAVDPRHVLAIGDGENDIEMLRMAGISVAMGNAGADVKAAAQFVTSSNDENGLALAVECFVLGGLEKGRCRVAEGGRIEAVVRAEVAG